MTGPSEPFTPRPLPTLAEKQAWWHTKQAAQYYAQSVSRSRSPQGRATARKRFVVDAKAALPVMGLPEFLRHFETWIREAHCGDDYPVAKATIEALAAELEVVPRADVPPALPDANDVAAIRKMLVDALAKIDALTQQATAPAGTSEATAA